MMTTEVNRESGFTLVEVLVATFVMSLLAAMGLMLLNDSISTRNTVLSVLEETQNLELARAVIKSDLAQVTGRVARDEFGYPGDAPFVGGSDLDRLKLMSFVRNGYEAPGLVSSGSRLQYVEYRFENDKLIRRGRLRVDAVEETPVFDRVLVKNIENVSISFFDGVAWMDQWGGTGSTSREPLAVSLSFEHSRYGNIEMIFTTPRGA
jgi:general secretion pathway protein J